MQRKLSILDLHWMYVLWILEIMERQLDKWSTTVVVVVVQVVAATAAVVVMLGGRAAAV